MFKRFLVFSGLAALVNASVGYLLYGVIGLDTPGLYGLSVAVGFLSGMCVSFVLNRRFTYAPSGRRARADLQDFAVVSIGGLSLTTAMAYVLNLQAPTLITLGGWSPLSAETSAHMIAIGVTAIYSFFSHKYFSFRNGFGTAGRTVWNR